MSKHKHRRKTNVCPNCGTILKPDFEFCPTCGQENHSLKIPIGHLVYEFIESIFHFDTKVWNTLKAIFTHPGRLTNDFVAGKRARYVPPARLYVFVAFFFFLMLNKVSDKFVKNISAMEKAEILQFNETKESEWDLGEEINRLRELGYNQGDSLEKALGNQSPVAQEKAIKSLKTKALTDSVSKYKNGMPFFVRDALLSNVDVKDSTLLKQIGFELNPVTDGLDLLTEINQLTQLGVFKKKDRDSLIAQYRQLPNQAVFDAFWQLKNKVLDDSLKRFGGKTKLSQSFKEVLSNNFSFDYETDSVYLQRAGIDRTQYEQLHHDFTTFTIEDVKVTRKKLNLFRTFSEVQLDSVLIAESPKYAKAGNTSKWFTRKLFKQGLKLNGTEDKAVSELLYKEFSHLVIKYVSFVMFLMMPVVAFLLLAIFYRLRKYYYEYLIFSVHVHTVLFMLMTIGFSLDYFFNLETIRWTIFIGIVYLFISLKNVYLQSWLKTSAKFFLLLMLYSLVASLFLVGAVFFGFINF